MKFLKTNTGIFLLLFIISFLIKVILLQIFRFDGFYGQDSYAYYENSKIFINSLYNLEFPPNFYWPFGFYLLTFIFNILTFGNTNLASLLVSLIAGSLLPGATFLLSMELAKDYYESSKAKKISLYTGLIICFSGIIIKSGMVVMSDMPGLLFIILSIYYLLKYFSENKAKYILFAVSFLSFSIAIRYANVLMVPLFCIIFVFKSIKNKKLLNLKIIVLSLIIALIILSPQLYYIVKFGISYFRTEEGPGVWITNWSLLNYFKKDFFTSDGSMNYRYWNLVFYFSPIFHPLYLSLFGFGFIAGLYYCFKNKLNNIMLFIFPWILVYIIYLSGNPFQSGRYSINFFPPLVIIASIGIFDNRFNDVFKKIYLVFALLLLLIYSIIHINNFVSEKNNDLLTIDYLEKNIPVNSMLFTFEITGAVDHYSKILHRDIYYYNSQTIKQLIDSTKSEIYMIIPERKIQTQWKGLMLEKTYYYLKDNYNLIRLCDINYYTIYKLIRK